MEAPSLLVCLEGLVVIRRCLNRAFMLCLCRYTLCADDARADVFRACNIRLG